MTSNTLDPLETGHAHPRLELLGPARLQHAAGIPGRDPRRCLEYAAFLIEHPGASTSQLASVFGVSPATVRTVTTYLRAWLGATADGRLYLPPGYQAGYHVEGVVTGDWEDLNLLVSAGIDAATDKQLVAGLRLVRGAPLADARPGEWRWAERLRIEMASNVRDIAHVLATRALRRNDVDQARWAAATGLIADPEDEQLLVDRLHTEQRAGAKAETARLAGRLRGNARRTGQQLGTAAAKAVLRAV